MTVFETLRLVARTWAEEDLERFFDLYSRWEVAKWLGSVPKPVESPEQAREVIARWATRGDEAKGQGVWAVVRRDTGVIAGTVLLVPLPGEGGEVEVGWHFHPDSWGQGFATEAARAALNRGFAHGLEEIYAVVRPGNEPSVKVCLRLGMTPLGRTTRWYDAELDTFKKEPRRRMRV